MYRMRSIAGAFLLLAAVACACIAADAPRRSNDSPKAVMRSLIRALNNGDIEKSQGYCLKTDTSKGLIETRAAHYAGWSRLQAALSQQFKGPSTQPGEPSFLAGKDIRAVDSSALDIEGDQASIQPSDRLPRIDFHRVDGQWKVDIRSLYADRVFGFSPEVIESNQRIVAAIAKSTMELSDEIVAGKYASIGQALDALKQREDAANEAEKNRAAAPPVEEKKP